MSTVRTVGPIHGSGNITGHAWGGAGKPAIGDAIRVRAVSNRLDRSARNGWCANGENDFHFQRVMLTAATLGLVVYGFYSIGWPVADLLYGARLEWWAELGIAAFGLLLTLSAAFVRIRIPGGLLLALGALLGLQALAVHTAAHLAQGLGPQIARAVFGLGLLGMAHFGSQEDE